MAIAVKMLHPNGGVVEPMAAWRVTMVPTSTLSSPEATTAGLKIGVRIMITTMGSTNMHPRKYAMLRTASILKVDGASPKSGGRIRFGIRAKETVQEKTCPIAIRMKTMAVTTPVLRAIFGISARVIDL